MLTETMTSMSAEDFVIGQTPRHPEHLVVDPDPADEPIEESGAALQVAPHQFDPAFHDGAVTLTSPRTGEHRTFRIRTVRDGDLAGARIVELLNGPDNGSDFQAFAFVSDGRHGRNCLAGTVCVWKRFRGDESGEPSIYERYADLLNRPAHWSAKGVQYLISLKCRRCGRDLTHPDSIADGLGPICRQKASGG